MIGDWRYSKEKLKLREQALLILLRMYGVDLETKKNQNIVIDLYTSVPMTGCPKVM